MCNNDKSCITINMGCCGADISGIGEGTPVGTIISYMGTKAPEHYLVCDGKEYKIADYPELAAQMLDEFGSSGYFGGDGVETFAVPDLRNEFLRGYHNNGPVKLSGMVGEQQEATFINYFPLKDDIDGNPWLGMTFATEDYVNGEYNPTVKNGDRDVYTNGTRTLSRYNAVSKWTDEVEITGVTVRPVNIAVLYCIRYERKGNM